jgi:hypothetical protein
MARFRALHLKGLESPHSTASFLGALSLFTQVIHNPSAGSPRSHEYGASHRRLFAHQCPERAFSKGRQVRHVLRDTLPDIHVPTPLGGYDVSVT